jgi:hypothetical protein
MIVNQQQQQGFPSLVAEGLNIIETAEKKGATLRLMGGAAIKIHTTNHELIHDRLGRAPGDIDFMALKKQSGIVKETMKSLGYVPNQQINAVHGHHRQIWYSKVNQIDIMLDVFEMCHVIDLRDRLKLDKPTITITDLFLQKIQIVQINEKDVKDLIILLLDHDTGEDDNNKINLDYLSKILGEDWGFWYTTGLNLGKISTMVRNYRQLTDAEKKSIEAKIGVIEDRLKSSPKSFRWKMREKVGTKTLWYKEVEEVGR